LLDDVERLAGAVQENQYRIDTLEQSIGSLKDKLCKARRLLEHYRTPKLTPEEKLDLEQVMCGSL
jgi:hypothetical protein